MLPVRLWATVLSVNSSSRRSGEVPVSARAAHTLPSSPDTMNCRGEMFTAIRGTFRPAASQAASWRSAPRSTQVPSGTIRPVSSASEMNSPGGTSAPSRRQRTSASMPSTAPPECTCG